MTPATATEQRHDQATDSAGLRPFRVEVPEAELTELRSRISTSRRTDTSQRVASAPAHGSRHNTAGD